MSLRQHFHALVEHYDFHRDPQQEQVLAAFEALAERLNRKPRTRGWPWRRRPVAERGIYLWGGVGRGKTWLMDLFCAHQRHLGIERHHFHSFMRQLHEALRHREGERAPLSPIVDAMGRRFRVLCLDEFQVIDIGDAMLLRALLGALEEAGITLVATSNQPPDRLYAGGIQRDSFLPAIHILQRNNQVIELGGGRDYRLELLQASSVYHTPAGAAATQALSREFARLAGESVTQSGDYPLPGRPMSFLRRGGGVIWCDFEALCGPPRWQRDYLELARSHHSVFVSDIPHLDAGWDDHARRFINLIDVFYDRKVKLVLSAENPPEGIYGGSLLADEFQRTASRLREMQSTRYLESAHLG